MNLESLESLYKEVAREQVFLQDLAADLTRLFRLQTRMLSSAKLRSKMAQGGIDEGWRKAFENERKNWPHEEFAFPILESSEGGKANSSISKIDIDKLIKLTNPTPKGELKQEVDALLESVEQIRGLFRIGERLISLSTANSKQLTSVISQQARKAKICVRDISRDIKRKEREQSQAEKKKSDVGKRLDSALAYFEEEARKVTNAENAARQILAPWRISYSAPSKVPTLAMRLQAVNLTDADQKSIRRYIDNGLLRGLEAADLNIEISIVCKIEDLEAKATHVLLVGEPNEITQGLYRLSVGRSSVSFAKFDKGGLQPADTVPKVITKLFGLPEGPAAFRFFSADRVSHNAQARKAIEALVDGAIAHARNAAHARLSIACTSLRRLAALSNGAATSKQFELESAQTRLAEQLEAVDLFKAAFQQVLEEEQEFLVSSLQGGIDTALSPGGQIGRLLDVLSSEHMCDAVEIDTKQEGATGLWSLVSGKNRKPYYYLSANSRVDLLRLLIRELRSVVNQLTVLEQPLIERTKERLAHLVKESGGKVLGESDSPVSIEPTVTSFSMMRTVNELIEQIPENFSVKEQKPPSVWGALKEGKKAPMQLMPIFFLGSLVGYSLDVLKEPEFIGGLFIFAVITFFVPGARHEQAKVKLMKDLNSHIIKAVREVSEKWRDSIANESQRLRTNIIDGLLTPAVESAKAFQESETKSEMKRLAELVDLENTHLSKLKSDLSELESLNKGLQK